MFIKLLMVRGILSASFPVIAVIFSPTFIKGNAQVSQTVTEKEKKHRVFSKWKTQVWIGREKKREEQE